MTFLGKITIHRSTNPPLLNEIKERKIGANGMKIFSTFSGIGGFEIGIHNAYLRCVQSKDNEPEQDSDHTQDKLQQWELPDCIGYSEIDKYAIKVYEKQFPNVRNFGDITKINAKELPDFDCLVGGFPCQAFSIAGKRGGFDDTRGTLFFDLARILREKQPRYFVFENVKGLLSHDQGITFRSIIATIDELVFHNFVGKKFHHGILHGEFIEIVVEYGI